MKYTVICIKEVIEVIEIEASSKEEAEELASNTVDFEASPNYSYEASEEGEEDDES
jgi:hypothetical protein